MGEMLLIGLKSTDGTHRAHGPAHGIADWTLRMRLQAIPGVAEVLNMGGGIKQAQVQPDPWRMQANGVTIEELEKRRVRDAAANTTGGFIDNGPQEIMVRNLAMTVDLEDIAKHHHQDVQRPFHRHLRCRHASPGIPSPCAATPPSTAAPGSS
jgi:Cu/Ag efflux pump CusA